MSLARYDEGRSTNKMEFNIYSVRHNRMLILYLLIFYNWLLLPASKDPHQANIYKNFQNVNANRTKILILLNPIHIYYNFQH